MTLSPGRYCNGITLQGISSATFQPGLYYIEGSGFRINTIATVTGTGVFFYLNAGQFHVDASANVNFTAATKENCTMYGLCNYTGILFFQNRSNTSEVRLTGGTQMALNGAVYAKAADMLWSGGNCGS